MDLSAANIHYINNKLNEFFLTIYALNSLSYFYICSKFNGMDEQYTQEDINDLVNWFNDKELPNELQINAATYSPNLSER